MSASGQSAVDPALYEITDYASWGRALYRRMPLPADTRVLFESTIDEPVDLLAQVVRNAFNAGVTDRFESVFGRGNRHLIAALAARYGVDDACILPTTGVSNAISLALTALVQPGDHILVETPCFDVLRALIHQRGARAGSLPRQGQDFGIRPDDLRQALRPDTRMVIISNLHNPSGRLLGSAELQTLGRIAAETGAMLLVDEVYGDFSSDTPVSAKLGPNIIGVNSLTKVFGLFSLRCGWLLAEPSVTAKIAEANAQTEFNVSKLAHAIAAHVLETPEIFEAHWRTVLGASRPVMARHFAAMVGDGLIEGNLPPHGCICFPSVSGISNTRVLAEELWRERNIIVAPGEFFDRPGHLRLGFGGPPGALDEGLSRLHEALHQRRRGAA